MFYWSVMVWGCFVASWPGRLAGINEAIEKESAQLPETSWNQGGLCSRTMIPNTSKSTSEWLKKNKLKIWSDLIEVISWILLIVILQHNFKMAGKMLDAPPTGLNFHNYPKITGQNFQQILKECKDNVGALRQLFLAAMNLLHNKP